MVYFLLITGCLREYEKTRHARRIRTSIYNANELSRTTLALLINFKILSGTEFLLELKLAKVI